MSDLTELETFVATTQAGSFAAAARRLGLSPAMVGRRIQTLEDRYGAKLIERTTRSMRLTVVGEEVLEKARAILEQMDELADIARPGAELSGRIRITGAVTMGITRLAPILADFAEAHPAVTLELSLSDRRVDLVAGGFDLALRIGELPSSSLVARRVGTYDFVCCAAPRYLDRFGAPAIPADLNAGRAVLNLNLVPRNIWPFFGPGGARLSVEVRGAIEVDNGEAMRMSALAGVGVIYAPAPLVAADLASGALVEVLPDWGKLALPFHTVHPSRRFVPRRVTALVEAVAKGLR